VDRADGIFDRSNEVEVVLGRIDLRQVRQDLDESERQHDCAVFPLLVDHVGRHVARRRKIGHSSSLE
jgi:hypothetical protein